MSELEKALSQLSVSIVHKVVIPEDCENQANYVESFIELKFGDKVISSNKIEPHGHDYSDKD